MPRADGQHNHVSEERLSGIRPPGLRVFQPVAGVPATRADCPEARPCVHARCRFHLWLVSGETRPGRRHDGRSPKSTLRPVWLTEPLQESCAIDVADRIRDHGAPPRLEVIAGLIGLRPSQARKVLADALRKLRAAGVLEEIDGP